MKEVFDGQEKKMKKKKKHMVLEVGTSYNPLSSFVKRPRNVRFSTQEENEEIVLLLRQHPVVNVGWILLLAIMIAAPGVVEFFPGWSSLPIRFQFMSIFLWYLLTIAYALGNFLNWYFNVCI